MLKSFQRNFVFIRLYVFFGGHWHHLVSGFGRWYVDTVCIDCGKDFKWSFRPWNSSMLPWTSENFKAAEKAARNRFLKGSWIK
jgi:hypothetical protein